MPCEPGDYECAIKGAHLSEKEAIEYINAHKYYLDSPVEAVEIEHIYMIKRELNGEEPEDYVCEGKYAWVLQYQRSENNTATTLISYASWLT